MWVFVVLLLVAVVRRIEAVGNYLPLYIDIEKVATDEIGMPGTCAEVGGGRRHWREVDVHVKKATRGD